MKRFVIACLVTLLSVVPALADNYKDFAKSTVSQGYNSASTAINLTTGGGARFPSAIFKAVWWNCTDFVSATDDPLREIILVNSLSGDSWTSITRGYAGTTAQNHNDGAKTYCVAQDWQADDIAQVYAYVDASAGGAQDILNMVAADLQANLSTAISTAGSTKAIRITNTQNATSNVDFSNVPMVWIPCPGNITWTNGLTVTFSRPEQIQAGNCQIFEAKDGVRFQNPGKINPAWWGIKASATAGSNTTAWNTGLARALPDAVLDVASTIELTEHVQVDNTLVFNNKNFSLQCKNRGGLTLTTTGSNKHLLEAQGATSLMEVNECTNKTAAVVTSDFNMKMISMDVGNGVSAAPAGSKVLITRSIIDGWNYGGFCDGGNSFVITLCLMDWNVVKSGGSGGIATNEGFNCIRIRSCVMTHSTFNGQSKAEHALYASHPLYLDASYNWDITGYTAHALKIITQGGGLGLQNPKAWHLDYNSINDNQGSILTETNDGYVLPLLTINYTAIKDDHDVASGQSAVYIEALGTSKYESIVMQGMQLRELDYTGIKLTTGSTATIEFAAIKDVQMYNWSKVTPNTFAAIYSPTANGTKRMLAVDGFFDGNSNGRNIFGTAMDTFWQTIQVGNIVQINTGVAESIVPRAQVGQTGNSYANLGGRTYAKTTTTGTPANTTETTLDTVTIPAKALVIPVGGTPNGFHIFMAGSFAANANGKTIRFKLSGSAGTTTIITNDKTASPNGLAWVLDLYVMYVGTDEQIVTATLQVDCVNQSPPIPIATAHDDQTAMSLIMTGQNAVGTANDVRHTVTVANYMN